MSLADFHDRELDLLADYAAGVLDRQSAAQVEHRLAADPVWAAALAELTEADSVVRAQLYAYGHGEPPTMPADVAARVDAALAAETRRMSGGAVVSLDAARLARRRRVTRLALAAAALLVVGVGVPVALKTAGSMTNNSGSTAAGQAQSGNAAGVAPPQAPSLPGVTITASGRDYTTSTLADAARSAPAPAPTAALTSSVTGSVTGAPGAAGDSAEKSASTPGSLSAGPAGVLRDPVRLSACLAAITADHPGRAVSVDYALFDSQPAVVVVVDQATGKLVVAAGSQCGSNGADELATARP
jgi:negative regulator of sigma E activity